MESAVTLRATHQVWVSPVTPDALRVALMSLMRAAGDYSPLRLHIEERFDPFQRRSLLEVCAITGGR